MRGANESSGDSARWCFVTSFHSVMFIFSFCALLSLHVRRLFCSTAQPFPSTGGPVSGSRSETDPGNLLSKAMSNSSGVYLEVSLFGPLIDEAVFVVMVEFNSKIIYPTFLMIKRVLQTVIYCSQLISSLNIQRYGSLLKDILALSFSGVYVHDNLGHTRQAENKVKAITRRLVSYQSGFKTVVS